MPTSDCDKGMPPGDLAPPLRQAVLLVGGRGTRLGPLTKETPKPLMPVAGQPFLAILIDHLARFGIQDILLVCGYLGEQIADQFDGTLRRGARIRCIIEPEPAGTAGALRHAAPWLDELFLLANGDCIFDVNVLALLDHQTADSWLAKLALNRTMDASRFGAVVIDQGRITAFTPRGRPGAQLINAGAYLMRRQILDWIDRVPCSLETEIFPLLATQKLLAGQEMEGFFLDIGVPEALAEAQTSVPAMLRRPAAFLDRDGVINVDIGYLHRPEDFQWIPGAPAAIRRLNDLGFWVFVVTNQSGVARGFYPEAAVQDLHRWINRQLQQFGAHVDAFFYCPHHPDGSVSPYNRPCDCRKPAAGLIEQAFAAWPVDPAGSFLIGDKISDMGAAQAMGLPGYLFGPEAGNLDHFLVGTYRWPATSATGGAIV